MIQAGFGRSKPVWRKESENAMITAVNEKTYDLRGISTDTKPHGPNVSNYDGVTVLRIANGSTYLEMDTVKVYFYVITGEEKDEDGSVIVKGTGEWVEA